MRRAIELYGLLKETGFGSQVELDLPEHSTAADAMKALKAVFKDKASLLDGAALASEEAVITPGEALPEHGRLAVLPPVCGG